MSVKPRYDNGGSEFGAAHRDLPACCGMFDIDHIKASAEINLVLSKQDYAFIEYRTNFNTADVIFKALFEIKYKDSESVRNIMKCKVGTAVFAQLKLAEKIGARFFFVIASNGIQPFKFYEFDNYNNPVFVGRLDYIKNNRKEKINEFWKRLGLI